jgi:tetratricopeptide (TPR) repeat protein
MNQAFEVLSREEPDEDLAALAAQLGRFLFFAAETNLAFNRIETALDLAEALLLPEVLSQALNTKGMILSARDRHNEALALLRYALDVALEHDKPSAALRAYYNLADTLARADRYEEAADQVRDGLALARRVGNRYWEWLLLGQTYPLFALGRWDEVLAVTRELPEEKWTEARQAFTNVVLTGVLVHVHRGSYDEASRIVSVFESLETSDDVQEQASYDCGKSSLLLARGEPAETLRMAGEAFRIRETMGVTVEYVKEAFVLAVEAALQLNDVAKAEEFVSAVEDMPPGRYPQFLRAQVSRFRARLGLERVEDDFKGAAGLFRELAIPFYLAATELEHAEWLTEHGRAEEAEPLLSEAREIFERLEATPWLERVGRLSTGVPA